MKSRKVVIIGLGSIGKRHLENIISLGYGDIILVRRNGEKLIGYENLEVFKTIEEGCLKYSFDIAVIATPTAYDTSTNYFDSSIVGNQLRRGPVQTFVELCVFASFCSRTPSNLGIWRRRTPKATRF